MSETLTLTIPTSKAADTVVVVNGIELTLTKPIEGITKFGDPHELAEHLALGKLLSICQDSLPKTDEDGNNIYWGAGGRAIRVTESAAEPEPAPEEDDRQAKAKKKK